MNVDHRHLGGTGLIFFLLGGFTALQSFKITRITLYNILVKGLQNIWNLPTPVLYLFLSILLLTAMIGIGLYTGDGYNEIKI